MSANDAVGSEPSSDSIPRAIVQILVSGAVAVVVTLIETSDAAATMGAKLIVADPVGAGKTIGSLGSSALDRAIAEHAKGFFESNILTRVFSVKEFAPALVAFNDAKLLFERIESEPRLVICGAGHVGASLAKLASMMGYQIALIDDRAEFLAPELFPEPGIELLAANHWSNAVAEAVGNGRGVSVAIVTRGHSEDEQCLRAVIGKDVDYIGMIGSKRRTNIVLQRLRQDGANEERLEKVHAPVGLDIGAVTPEEVALAIMAEVVAERRGGKGGSLSAWRWESKPGERGEGKR
jgi:xanthine dehydrogenase accessory factor